MKKERAENIKQILVERVLTLQESIDRSLHGLRQGNGVSPDLYDLAVTEADTSMELAIREQNQLRLISLREALVRMENGRFGVCESCGEPIPRERLLANPVALVCVACKTREEKPGC
jgi:DnaK suppressor protein